MKVLIVSVYGVGSYSRGVMADVLQQQIVTNPHNSYFYLSCSETFDTCYFNKDAAGSRCAACRYSIINSLNQVTGKYVQYKLRQIIDQDDFATVDSFFTKNPIISRQMVYGNFDLGEATISTYISLTRDKELLNLHKTAFAKKIARNSLLTYLGARRFIKDNSIELVYNFNGRQDYLRAIFRACHDVGVKCINVERARPGGFIEFYDNSLPYNIKAKQTLIENFWNESLDSERRKISVGSQFFEKKREGLETISRVYTANQERNYLPSELDNGQRNIVLFNSSDDEHAAVGDEYRNPFFENQNEGIMFLIALAKTKLNAFNLIIRMHPNLANVKFDYMHSVLGLHQKYKNVFVYGPDSSVDTYALIDTAYKVITFGSTAGLEASYSGVPVVLLGKGRYYYSDVAYVPEDKSQIIDLLVTDLPAKPKINALKFGYYYSSGGVKTQYYYQKGVFSEVMFKDRSLNRYTVRQNFVIYYRRFLERLNKRIKR